ncbi:putative membrane protein [Rhizocola hellebori]|uniref:Putative membrane protein n=1 Tax=Rhizocola hellebori TaxID=1392758 RepID=A0A8J3VF27_9ACTN|nr:MMPL family transporter [Rhizocola hellebori]GIH03747.1 putative membrane protein [Rhizocola hellebori]
MPESVVGRVGRWCFRHWAWVLLIWAVAVGAGVFSVGPLFSRLADTRLPKGVESVAAADVISQGNDSAGTVIAVVDGIDPADARVRSAVLSALPRLAAISGVKTVEHPYTGATPSARMVSADGHAIFVSVVLTALDRPGRDKAAIATTDALHELRADLPAGASVDVGGAPVLSVQTRGTVQEDLARAEYTSLPVTLLVLVVVFGGLVAAGLPVLTAAVSVAAAMGVMLGFSTFTNVDQDGVTVVTLLGLGLSVDYGLLLVARYREELLGGWPPETAIARAWATAGRTILFSALTVAAALSGLLLFDLPTLTALGAAGVSIAVVAMVASLTFTAALTGLLRRWIRPTKRQLREAATLGADSADRGFFARLSRLVQRRPVLVALGTAAILLAAGAPLVDSAMRLPGLEGIPRSIESARVADTLAQRFARRPAAAITVVAHTDPATLQAWAQRWAANPAVAQVRPVQPLGPTGAPTAASVGFDVVGDPQGTEARGLVAAMRADRPAGGQSWVTGDAATLSDLLAIIGDGLPWAIGLTVLAMVALLFAMTGSLVIPVKAILANVVSLGATFGVMTAVFGDGFASDLLDTLTIGALNPFVVVLVFAFAFGLSMDYEIFLLGRVKEYVDAGADTDAAVRRALQRTGRVITSAALLMVIVFGCFAAARIGNIEQIGLGLAVAVLIDATVVRCLLVPATMTLLGRWNWWAPRWLSQLHARFGLHEHRLPEIRAEDHLIPEPAVP